MHDLHVLGDVGEDGGLDEVSLVPMALSSSNNRGTFLLALLDVAHDTVVLQLGDLRTLEGVGAEWIADLVLDSARLELLNKLVVDTRLDVDARTSTAALAVVEENAKVDPGDGVFNVGVVENDVWRLASELEGNLLQVGAGCGLHDLTANNGRPGKCDLVNIHVGRDGGTGDLSKTGDDVDDSWWETGLLDEVGSNESGERGLLGSLENNGVTGGNRRANLPRPHEQWEVPWDDLTANANLDYFIRYEFS